MPATSKDKAQDLDYLPCGKITIKLNNDLTISIYSDGYSLQDLIEKEDRPKQEFKSPIKWEDYIKKDSESGFLKQVDKLKAKHKDYNYSELEKWNEQIQCYREELLRNCKENLKRILNTSNYKVKDIEFYEPPIKFEEKRKQDGKGFEKVLRIDKDKAILIGISEQDERRKIFDFAIRFQENAKYYVIFEKGKNDDSKHEEKKYKLEVSSTGFSPPQYLTPYRGSEKGWIVNFSNQLFYGELCIFVEEDKQKNLIFRIPILVYPKKLSPEDVMKIIDELMKLHSGLIIDYTEATGLTILPGERWKKTPLQRLKFIKHIWKKRELEKVLQSIIDNPHKQLVVDEVFKNIEEIGIVSPLRITDMVTNSEALIRVESGGHILGGKFAFTKAYDEVVRISHDTYPNRFVKFFLKYLFNDLHNIIETIGQLAAEADSQGLKRYYESFILDAKNIQNNVLRSVSMDFFNEVSDLHHLTLPPQVLLKEDRYQTIFKSFLELIKGVISDDELEELLKDPIKNMPELYEYWCFLKMWELLKVIYNSEGKITFNPEFKKGTTSIESNKWEIEWDEDALVYQNYIPARINENNFYSYSIGLQPDIYLKMQENLIILDAKYRVDFVEELLPEISEQTQNDKNEKQNSKDKEKIESIKNAERRGEFKRADLYKMHTYREAIIRRIKENEKTKIKRPVFVFALYPGDTLALFNTKDEKLIAKIISDNKKLKFNIFNKDKKDIFAEFKEIKDKKIRFNLINSKNKSLEFSLTGGVGAIPFRPELLENQEYRDFIGKFF